MINKYINLINHNKPKNLNPFKSSKQKINALEITVNFSF